MSTLRVSDIVRICNAKWLGQAPDHEVSTLLTDSRKVSNTNSAVFFAIKGINHDGHEHVSGLIEAGVQTFVVESDMLPLPEHVNILRVDSSLAAIQSLARYKRELFTKPVIGITGSNGKTIVKEWLSKMLSKQHLVAKSPRSYNSQLGVPLSVWEVSANHDLAVFEAGISQMNEMVRLERVIQPTHGILTNIGTAHEDGFASKSEKLREKLKLFGNCQSLIYCADYPLIEAEVRAQLPASVTLFSWAFDAPASIRVKRTSDELLSFDDGNQTFTLTLPFTDDASVENFIHCVCTMLSLTLSPEQIAASVTGLEPVDMRLKLLKGINQSYLIDDSYNNDLAGLETALDFLAHQQQHSQKTLILSDLLQVTDSKRLYQTVSRMLEEKGVTQLIGIGPELMEHSNQFNLNAHFFADSATFLRDISSLNLQEQVILIKGARPFQFERIVKRLAEKAHQTVFEINLDAITQNLNYYRGLLKPGVRTMVMVKAFAYGSGIAEVAQLLQFHKVHYLAVAYTDEGVTLRKNGIHLPIMVMNTHDEDFDTLIEHRLEPEIFSLKQLRSFQKAYAMRQQVLPVHLNINTGMNRLGFELSELDALIRELQSADHVEIKSAFTHLAGADESEHNDFSIHQLDSFKGALQEIEKRLNLKITGHALNSAGIQRFPDHQFDMVRLGIGLYGLESSGMHIDKLQTAGTLKTVVSQVKHIKAGETIGYSRRGLAKTDMKIATVAIGYADGFSRAFSNGKGQMLIKGKKAPVIGNVCMDMCMLDITGIETSEGDEVIVFGESPSMQELADRIGTIPYEILTNVSERVKRIYLKE